MAAPLVTRKRLLAAAIETTPGTPASLSASNAAWNCYDVKADADISMIDRAAAGQYLSPISSIVGPQRGRISFTTDVIGGSSPAWCAVLLAGCGWGNDSGTFSPDSLPPEASGSTAKTLTIAAYIDGTIKKLCGAMGNFVIRIKRGEPTLAEFTFEGCWVAPAETAILAPTYPSTKPPRGAATVSIGALAPKVSEIAVASNNTLQLREDASASSGYHSAVVVSRRPTITIDPEAALGVDWWGLQVAGTVQAVSLVTGTTGNKVTIAAPAAQVVKVADGDRGGVYTYSVELLCNRSTGDDELTITPG